MGLADGLFPAERQNVGGIDRKLRAVVGTLSVVAGVWLLVAGRPAVAALGVVAGAGLLFNAVTGFCGVNALLGIDTCPREKS